MEERETRERKCFFFSTLSLSLSLSDIACLIKGYVSILIHKSTSAQTLSSLMKETESPVLFSSTSVRSVSLQVRDTHKFQIIWINDESPDSDKKIPGSIRDDPENPGSDITKRDEVYQDFFSILEIGKRLRPFSEEVALLGANDLLKLFPTSGAPSLSPTLSFCTLLFLSLFFKTQITF